MNNSIAIIIAGAVIAVAAPRWPTRGIFGRVRLVESRIAAAVPALPRKHWASLVLLIAVQFAWPLSGAFADQAAATSDANPAPTSSVVWYDDNFFTECDGNCAVTVFGGPELRTHMYNLLFHATPVWDYRYGNADVVGGAISRRLLTLWDSLDIETEFGVAKRFGDVHAEEAWLSLYFRWTRFPWNQYLRTSVALTTGPSVAVDLPARAHNAVILEFFSPQITFALPQYPQYELMVQLHHRSDFVDTGTRNTPDPNWQYMTIGLRYRF